MNSQSHRDVTYEATCVYGQCGSANTPTLDFYVFFRVASKAREKRGAGTRLL